MICDGANAVGRACFSDLSGYSSAFFGFANGIERLAKTVCAVDSYLETNSMPTDAQLRDFGHGLVGLVDAVDRIMNKRGIEAHYPKPVGEISWAVLTQFDAFADAKRGRYFNFFLMRDAKTLSDDPISSWWVEVCQPILETHFYGTKVEERNRQEAELSEQIAGPSASIFYVDETGGEISSVREMVWRGHLNSVTQKYGRFYALSWARWLSACFRDLIWKAEAASDPVVAHQYEFLSTLLVSDEFLLHRKVWPLK